MRLGLCCQFYEEPIKFKSATVTVAKRRDSQYLRDIYEKNIEALSRSLKYCSAHGIHAFRVSSALFPLATHTDFLFDPATLKLDDIKKYADRHNITLSLHPDQFVVLNSPKEDVVRNSIRELEYQAKVADLLGAEQITLHAGGVYGDKTTALARLIGAISLLSPLAKKYLCLENDDKSYSPRDILSVCEATGCRFIYDIHHHRFNGDDLSYAEATDLCLKHWHSISTHKVQGWVHLSSSKNCTSAHDDFIDFKDFPLFWTDKDIIIDIEAKAKEAAVLQLRTQINQEILRGSSF